MGKDLTKLSYEELQKKEKGTSVLMGLLMGLGLTLLGFTAYDYFVDGVFDSTIIIALCCLAALPFSMKELKAVKAELASRKDEILS